MRLLLLLLLLLQVLKKNLEAIPGKYSVHSLQKTAVVMRTEADQKLCSPGRGTKIYGAVP
jgi:hypothetical protein